MRLLTHYCEIIILLAGFLTNGCSVAQRDDQLSASSTSESPVPMVVNSTKASPKVLSIRDIDFANFEYPLTEEVRITLRNGRYEGNAESGDYPFVLSNIVYGDVTHDGSEEAMVVLSENVKGSAIPYYVFIYSNDGQSTKLLWSFETGDRADGGLRQVYAENGDLVIELYGNGTSIGGELYGTEKAACCPRFISRTRYKWIYSRFLKKGDIEVSPNPSSGAPVIIPAYQLGTSGGV